MGGIGEVKGAEHDGAYRSMVCFRDYGATRGFANESEFTVVKVILTCVSRLLLLTCGRLTSTTISKAT